MLNILKSEILKLKKDAMFYTGTIISILMPILVILKDEFLSSPPDNLMDWVMTCCLVDFMVLSILSGFIITNSVQKEYQSGALTNILAAAVSRASFLFAKLAVWFVWYVLLLIYMEFVTVIGSSLLYPSYPAILVTIGFTGILIGGASISMEMILPASMIPWTAVSLVALYQVQSPYCVIGIFSISLTGVIGLLLALREIYKQDQ
ncbi:MAG: ABC transporter permease [Oliverpabstia sp.]